MARLFDDANNEYLQNASAVLTAPPLTMAAWAYSNDDTLQQSIMWMGDKDKGADYFSLEYYASVANDPVFYWAREGVTGRAEITPGPSKNTWFHICGVSAAWDDHACYLNGGSKATNSDDATGMNTPDRTSMGSNQDSSPGQYFSGMIAEAAIWNVALTDAEVAILADGFSPLLVRPQSLVAYWPLIGRYSPEIDLVGGYDMTLNSGDSGPVAAAHPRIIYPSVAQYGITVAAAGLSPAVAAYYYRMLRTGGC